MSLCMMVKQPGAAHLITDGGVWDESGILIGIGRKVALLPALNAAIAFTGFGGHCEWIEEAIERAGITAARALLQGLPQILHDEIALHGRADASLKLHAITYDPEPGPACWIISSDAVNMPSGYRPFTVRSVGGLVDFGDPSAILGRPVHLDDPASFDVVRDGATLTQAARLLPWEGPDGPVYAVGGLAELTTVGPQGLRVRRLCEWPEDRLGKRTDPFRMAA